MEQKTRLHAACTRMGESYLAEDGKELGPGLRVVQAGNPGYQHGQLSGNLQDTATWNLADTAEILHLVSPAPQAPLCTAAMQIGSPSFPQH